MDNVISWLLVAVLAANFMPAMQQDFCESGNTEVKTRWLFTQDMTCTQLIGGVSDVYNEVFRYDCQWALQLDSMPHSVEKSYVTNCFVMKNGTVKYRAKVCCNAKVRAFAHSHF
ncbi:hypothetical protein LSAT2_007728 [Lamellibrachia satsuma]|nr:hypothetical protein LSAT2_007728 [Lamellibrachia satsuma]